MATALTVLLVTESIPNVLDPRGPAGSSIAGVWWLMFALGAAVFVAVCVLLGLAAFRQRDGQPVEGDRWTGEQLAGGGNLLIVIGGVVVPAVIVVGLMIVMITTGERVRALDDPDQPTVVEVVGYKFWFDVTYPDEGIRIANEVRVPVGETVEIHVSSADVIHSFWVPQVGGKIDMTPGEDNVLRLQADEAGTYRGLCTEYCGIQHARMHFMFVAMEPDDYEDWVAERTGRDAAEPETAGAQQGREIFEGIGCAECHTVDGVSPPTDLGPDLTHFGDRLTLGAGIWPNDREHLAEWVLDPQDMKAGSRMPPTNLDDGDLDALLDYLEGLQ